MTVWWRHYQILDVIKLISPRNILSNPTVYPKKYAHGFCFAVLCCGYTLTDFPISIRLTSLALWKSNDCPSASKATLMNMDKYFMWIHYERLHNHNRAKHNKTVCIFLGYTVIMILSAMRSNLSVSLQHITIFQCMLLWYGVMLGKITDIYGWACGYIYSSESTSNRVTIIYKYHILHNTKRTLVLTLIWTLFLFNYV